jgi:penicillin-binding protein 2
MAVAEDRRRITVRLVTLQVGAVVLFAALAIAFWFLQIVQNRKFEEMAENNHQRTLALRAPRGVLFDRNGTVLVENRHAYRISIVREHTKDMDRTIHLLSGVAGLDPASVKATVDRHRGEPSYRPIVVVEDASLAQVAAITARRLDFELPDVVVEEVPTRQYPTDALAAHLFGYVGQASDTQLGDGIQQGAIIGQSGVERVYNKLLMGEDGAKRVVVNSMGREIRTLDEVPPTEGRRVQLTIDHDLQRRRRMDSATPASTARRSSWTRATARCSPTSAFPHTTRMRLPRESIAPRGHRSTPTSCGRCRTA